MLPFFFSPKEENFFLKEVLGCQSGFQFCFAFFQDLANMMKSFRYDAHPMGMLATTVCAMGTIQSDANPALRGQDVYNDKNLRNKQLHRLIGSMPTMAAFAYRHRMGK